MNLHSEVLRYSSSAYTSTIRPLFEYLFMTISGYDHGCFNPLNWWTFRPTPRNFEMAIISPSNGCNDLYPLEFAVQFLNGTRGDLLDEVLLKMKLCSTEQGVFGHQEMLRSGEVSFKSGLLTRR